MSKGDTANARAAASHRNGARWQGPRTAAGRARRSDRLEAVLLGCHLGADARARRRPRSNCSRRRRASSQRALRKTPRRRSCRRPVARPNKPEKLRQNNPLACG
jgi:hypothetical protein